MKTTKNYNFYFAALTDKQREKYLISKISNSHVLKSVLIIYIYIYSYSAGGHKYLQERISSLVTCLSRNSAFHSGLVSCF